MGLTQRLQTPVHKHPVFAYQGHHICHRAKANHIGIFLENMARVAAEGAGQLEGNTHTGKILMGVAIAGAVGVDHSHSLRKNVFTFVVVGDHQVDPQFLAKLGLRHGGDAAVHGDDQLDAFAVELVNGDGVQAVAFFQTAGDIADRIRTAGAEEMGQQAGGGDAVHIVVAEHGDLFATGHSQRHAAHRQVHIRHQIGVGQGAIATQETIGIPGVFHAAGSQNHGAQGSVSAGNQGVDRSHLRGLYIPKTVFHFYTHPL